MAKDDNTHAGSPAAEIKQAYDLGRKPPLWKYIPVGIITAILYPLMWFWLALVWVFTLGGLLTRPGNYRGYDD